MRIFPLLCTILYALCGHAATNEYSIVIKGPFDSALFDITQGHDRSLNTVGYSHHFISSPASSRTYTDAFEYLSSLQNGSGDQVRLIRLDDAGKSTLDTSMKLVQFNRAVSLVNTPSNGYFIGGSLQNGQLFVANLSNSGNTNFLHQFGTANHDSMSRLIELNDGGVLAVGSSATSRSYSDDIHSQGLGLNDIYLTRFSKSGQKIWSKKYGTSDDDQGIAAAEARDGSLLVTGSTKNAGGTRLTLMRLSENGDKIWMQPYGKNEHCVPHDIISLRDGSFILSLSILDKSKGDQIRLIKFDLQGNISTEKNVPTQRSNALLRLKEQSNGRIIGVGYSTDRANADTDAIAMLFDPELRTLWDHRYGGKNRDLFRSVTVLHDGRFAAVGETVSPGSEISDMWIVKLNDDGSIALKSNTGKSLFDALADTFADDIAQNTIRLTKDLGITLTAPRLLFQTGIYELNGEQKKYLNEFSKKLFDVLKEYKKEIAGLRINGHTSSEWANSDFTRRYLKNAELSAQRAYSVLSHIFMQEQTAPFRPWLADILTNNGYAFSRLVRHSGEDREASRRAEFRILLK